MTLPSEIPRSFGLYVTHVEGEGHFFKISGQLDQQASLMIESLFETARENLESGLGAPTPAAIHEGIICAAKYKDGVYYRAKIINTTRLSNGLVGVHFIDYGNKDNISLSAIRFLDKYDPMFLKLRGQATYYYLSRVMNPSGIWEERLLLKLESLICNTEYPGTIDAQTRTLPFISLVFNGTDLSTHLVSIRLGIAIPLPKQEALLLEMLGENPRNANWQPNFNIESSGFPEHVPFLNNQNFPFNPASAMRQHAVVPFNGSVPPPSLIYQRLQANRVSRNPVNLKPARQPQLAAPPFQESMPPSTPPVINSVRDQKPNNSPLKSPKKSITYKSRLLEVNSEHQVSVSYAEEGPELFAVQLVADANKLQILMDEINKRPHSSLKEPPMIGTVCLGRMSGDRVICRAIVMNLSGSQCKLFFVDFGDTEMVSYYDIFDIPEEFVKPNVFAMRFCLSGVKKLEKGPHLNETFKQLAFGKILKLRVVSPEGPPLIQYGELYLDDKNLFDLVMANMKDKLQFKWMEMLPLGSKQSVLVSYVDSCIKFYVQLSDKIDELNSVMDAVRVHCEKTSSPGELPVGAPCCARFPDDEKWYRARVRSTNGDRVVVTYVDYGNEQEIRVSDLRTINPELIKLPAQAIKCALKGFENKPVETKTSNQLEMLALEKTLMAHIVGVLSSDTMLVTLVDDTVSPPLDVARKMNQLSQPRSSQEVKVTTPIWKDAPESFSSPESNSDDGRKKNFRREKSFKDDRRQKEDGEEFSPRGGSFRGSDNREGFDRSAPARHSEKFAPRQERGDRRGGSKPWENSATSPPHASNDDVWAENPSHSAYQQPPNRGQRDANRDRRKPKAEHQDRGQKGWRGKETGGVGKRLRQAVEAASESAQRTSVQDRLKRDYKSNHEDREEWKEDWGNRTGGRPDRPDRRDNRTDNRGDRRDNRGERRDNRKEWNDRPKSNFSPRDRAERVERSDRSERSYGSECDRYSEKSNRSQDNSRAGRAPPYKPRSKFTQVQYKELPNPIPLTTPFSEPTVEPGSQHEVSVTWIISPESFYTQILSLQPKFLEMMQNIPELYKGVKSYTGEVPVGATVLARYPVDGVLYRATVVAVQPFSKFIVRYVDFGNKQLVDAKDIWQVDNSLMELPKMAVHCSLIGVMPKDEAWKADAEIDLCFNAPRYQCIFQENVDGQYKVSLWNNGVSVTDMLVEKQLAKLSDHQSSVTLKDEAIDLTIIVGQQILCRVTHVESFEKFYVQLDLEKSALVEKAIANFDTSKLTPLIADNLIDGIHCTVKHNDKIYRAILEDVSDPANITAVLPDFGYSITTSLEHLMILPNELSVYYYQSLQCCFNNYTPESKTLMSVEELKSRLTGNKFIIYINNVEEIRLVSTLYDSVTGEKVAIFEPDEGAYDEVVPLCTRSVFNYSFGLAYIAHIENLNEIYLQKSSDGDRVAELLDEMYKFYEEGSSEPLTTFEVNGLCAAKSSDSNWYRATIITVEETQVKVQFPDYGNTEIMPKESLKKLDPKFYEPCALALVASLSLVALQDNAISKLIEWTTEKEVQVTLAFGTDEWLASLHLDGVDLAMKLVNEKLATPQLISNEEQQHEKAESPVEEPISLPEGCTQVYISHIDTPGHFWLQMLDKVEKIEAIQAELQTNANFYPDIENREMGTWCVAKYLADDQWYRAEILDSDSDITTVRFIDYGNTDVLDNQPGLIKELPEHMKQIERIAIKSSVNAVPTGTGQWSEPASDYFTQLVGDVSAPVDVLIVLKDVTTYVDIFVNGQNLTDKLVTEGHAARSEEAECGDLPSCFASHVNSPSEFWIQLETAAPELQAMEAAMIDAENFPALEEKEEGVICAAKYPEDDAWYRAQVIVDGSEGTEVLFMDYGNASIANELRNLPDELKVKPALSRKCALQKPRDVKSWSRKSEIKFNELAAEGATIFKVQFIASGDISIVDLYLDGKSVTEELVGLCEEVPISGRPTPVGQDLRNNGKICFVNSVEEFYVQLEDSDDELDKVLDRIAGAPEFEPITELKVGSLCAALWCDDEQWYRAKVLEFCDVGYHVQFIDYGNKAKCEEFRQLPEDLIHIEPLAKCCRLAGFPLDIDMQKNGRNKLDDYAAEVTTFEIEFLDTTKEPLLVKMFVDGKDVVSIITSENVNTIMEIKSSENFEPEISNGTIHKSESVEEITNNSLQDLETSKSNVIISDSIANNNVEHRLEENVENNEIEEKFSENKSKQSEITAATENVGDDLNASQKEELDESFESNHTVIENKSFDSKDNLSDASLDEGIKEDVPMSPDQNISSDTFEYSNETEGSPKREESKDSITDTGFTSCSEQDKVKGFELDEESQENHTHEKDTQKKVAESKENNDDKLVKETNTKQIQETESEDKSIKEKSVEENMAEPESQVSQEKIEEVESPIDTSKTECPIITEDSPKKQVVNEVNSKEEILNKTE